MPSSLRLKPNTQPKIQQPVQPEKEEQVLPVSLKLKSEKNQKLFLINSLKREKMIWKEISKEMLQEGLQEL